MLISACVRTGLNFICCVFLNCRGRVLKSQALGRGAHLFYFKFAKQISISQFTLIICSKTMHIFGKNSKKTPTHLSLFFFLFNSLIFGAITCFTGFLGVITGAGATKWCRLKTQRADPLVCAVGMLGSAIFICLIFVAAKSSIVGAYVSIILCVCPSHSYLLYKLLRRLRALSPAGTLRCWSCSSPSECPSFCPLAFWHDLDVPEGKRISQLLIASLTIIRI